MNDDERNGIDGLDDIEEIVENVPSDEGLGTTYENAAKEVGYKALSDTTGLDRNIVEKGVEAGRKSPVLNPGHINEKTDALKNKINNLTSNHGNNSIKDKLNNVRNRRSVPNQNNQNQDQNKDNNNQGQEQSQPEQNQNNQKGGASNIKKQLANKAKQGLKSALGLGNGQEEKSDAENKADEVEEKVEKTKKIIDKIRKILPYLPMILEILEGLAFAFVAIMVILIPLYWIAEKLDDAANWIDKATNFISGQGFNESSQVVSDKLEKAKENYEKNTCGDVTEGCFEWSFDTGILTATIQLNNIIDPNAFEETAEETSSGDYKDEDRDEEGTQVVSSEKSRSFYNVQNMLLGSPEISGYAHLTLDDRGLIYNLVDYKVGWTCTDSTWEVIKGSVETISDTIALSTQKARGTLFVSPTKILKMLKDIFSMTHEGYSILDYAIDHALFDQFDSEKKNIFFSIFNEEIPKCGKIMKGDKEVNTKPRPYLKRWLNYSNYLTYVREVIVPLQYYDCFGCRKNYTREEKRNLEYQYLEDLVAERNHYSQTGGDGSYLVFTIDDNDKITAYLVDPVQAEGGFVGTGSGGALRGDLSSLVIPPGSTGFNGQIHFYSQTDYKDYTYYADRTIARSGCGPTSLSIAISSLLGVDHDPVELVNMTCNIKHLCTARNGTYWSAMVSVPPEYGIKSRQVGKGTAGVQQVIDALSTGNAIVIAIMGPGHFTSGGHFITLTGVNSSGQVYVVDPNNGERKGKNKWWDLNIIVSENNGAFWILTK